MFQFRAISNKKYVGNARCVCRIFSNYFEGEPSSTNVPGANYPQILSESSLRVWYTGKKGSLTMQLNNDVFSIK